jgi:hypothetical protein
MSIEDWMMSLPPCMGGKRPRSPVEKLADLQGQAEAEDEDNWRNSKRYLSEVSTLQHPRCSKAPPAMLTSHICRIVFDWASLQVYQVSTALLGCTFQHTVDMPWTAASSACYETAQAASQLHNPSLDVSARSQHCISRCATHR